jgi:hypothetical protein
VHDGAGRDVTLADFDDAKLGSLQLKLGAD